MHVLYSDCAIWKEVLIQVLPQIQCFQYCNQLKPHISSTVAYCRPWTTFILQILLVGLNKVTGVISLSRHLRVMWDLKTDTASTDKATKDGVTWSLVHMHYTGISCALISFPFMKKCLNHAVSLSCLNHFSRLC